MSLGHWCFVCTVFFGHFAEFVFLLDWKSFKLKHLELFWIHWTIFVSSKHWLGSLITVELYYLTTVEHYSNCGCRNWSKDWATLSRDWPRVGWLPTGKMHCGCLRWPMRVSLPLKCWRWLGVWICRDSGPTFGHPGCRCREDWVWDTEMHLVEPGLASDWWTVHGLRYSVPSPDRRQNWQAHEECWDTVSQLQDAALLPEFKGQTLWRAWQDWPSRVMFKLRRACALRPRWGLPRRSLTLGDPHLTVHPQLAGSFKGLRCYERCRSTGLATLTQCHCKSPWHWLCATLHCTGGIHGF